MRDPKLKTLSKENQPLYLWEVSGGRAKMYLLGTVHILPENVFPLHPKIMNAFDQCERVVCEIDIKGADMGIVELPEDVFEDPRYVYPPNDGLYNYCNKQSVKVMREYIFEKGTYPENVKKDFDRLRPEVVQSLFVKTVYKEAGVAVERVGIDMFLLEKAREENKIIMELETREAQKKLFEMLHPAKATAKKPSKGLLENKPRHVNKVIKSTVKRVRMQTLMAHVLYLGLDKVDADVIARRTPHSELLLNRRNKLMTRKLQGYLHKPNSYFVAVGAMHFLGKGSIVELLEKEGYTVRAITLE